MKRIFSLVALAVLMLACNQTTKASYASFGEEIKADGASDVTAMAKEYSQLKAGDSLDSKMVAKVKEVCQAKGCWMTLQLDDDSEVLVRFKDYGFFVPKDIAGSEVVINGKAFVTETSVGELRHYAEDAGKSQEEIEKITEPEKTYAFLADGVLVKE